MKCHLILFFNFSDHIFTLVIDLTMSFPYEVPAADTLSRCQATENISKLKQPQGVESKPGIMKLIYEI